MTEEAVNVLLFDNFETLDIFGPVEVFGRVKDYALGYYSLAGGVVTSSQGVRVETQPYSSAPKDSILVIPGGMGTRPLSKNDAYHSFLNNAIAECRYCLTICTGSTLIASTGILDGRSATSNKLAMKWTIETCPKVNWQKSARWVIDGKFYTASGVSAGIDMSLGFIADRFDKEFARDCARKMEYVWNDDPAKDPFAVDD